MAVGLDGVLFWVGKLGDAGGVIEGFVRGLWFVWGTLGMMIFGRCWDCFWSAAKDCPKLSEAP